MNRILLVFLLMLPYFFGQAQITLDASHIPSIGDVFVNYVDTMPVPSIGISNAGPDQVWDFTSLQKLDSLIQAVVPATDAFGGDAFPNADIALTTDVNISAQFAQLNANELTGVGLVTPNPFLPEAVVVSLDPTQTVATIPTNYSDSYIDEWGFVIGVPPIIDMVDSIRVTNSVEAHIDIDAWGTVQLPSGEYEVLRQRDSSVTEILVEGLLGFFWVPVQTIVDTMVTYNFLAKETKGTLVSLSKDLASGTVDQVIWVGLSNQTLTLPVADFSFEAIGDPLNREISFTDLTVNDPTAWYWEFGDGSTSLVQFPTHEYDANGTYEVCLTASNLAGVNTTCKSVVIDVLDAPVAAYSFEVIDFVHHFTDESTNSPLQWQWDLGDGTVSIEQNPTHQYVQAGEYTVCLIATNASGSDEVCTMIDVSLAMIPEANFSVESDLAVATFTDLSTNTPTSWSWDFGDGNTGSEQNPIHTYASDGVYEVCLTAGNSAGEDESCQMVPIVIGAASAPWQSNWKLQPNPTSDDLYLELDGEAIGSNVLLYNSVGQLIYKKNYQGKTLLDLSASPSGMYLIVIKKGNEIIGSQKVVRQ